MEFIECEEVAFYNFEEIVGQVSEEHLVENDVQPTEEIHEENPYQFEFCQEGSTTDGSLVEQEKLDEGIYYICPTCRLLFSNEAMLTEHINNVHPVTNALVNEGEDIQHTPPQEVLNSEPTLKKEIRNIVLFICTICEKVLFSKKSWKNHMAAHDNNFAFPCKACEKSFTNAASLKLHETTHDPKKKYDCSECEKSFRQKPHLEAHFRSVHLKLKPFKCKICGKDFSQNGNLKQHLFVHDKGQSQHVCSVCDASFCNASRLRRHEKIHSKSES